ncbi:MAG: LysM peptidoglycan-binding domain-containing protein [Syntrophaceae bacterium]|nr:LysM peptidoglycan-binding domain-containing protein [Syntrophaceae bacterium]
MVPLEKKRSARALLLASFFLVAGLFLLPFPAGAADGKTIEITVVKNDNLIDLCKKYLENPLNWPKIGRINRLKDYDLIYPGQKLNIPVGFLRGLPVSGHVIFVKGNVAVRAGAEGPWKPVRLNDYILQGNMIRTGGGSAVEIVFEDGTTFLQRPDTILDVNVSQRKEGDFFLKRMILQSGQLLVKLRRILGRESQMEIRTPSAVALARGTEFRVSVDEQENLTSEVLEGIVDVKAMNQSVALKEGEGTRVVKGAPPAKPRRLLPPPRPTDLLPVYRNMPLRFRFAPAEGAVSHRILLTSDAEGKDAIREEVIRAGDTAEFPAIEDGPYYLHGRSIDEIGIEGLPLAPQKINVRTRPLPPFIQAPVDGSRLKGKTVPFRWMKVPDAVRYQIQTSRASTPPETAEGLTETAETAQDLSFPDFGTYSFRIRSKASDGFEGGWSDTLKVTLIPPPPSPVLEKPALEGKNIHIRWRDQGPKMTYRCQIAREESFRKPVVDEKVNRPEITLSRPADPGVYYVRTSTIDAEGFEGGFSPPQSFEIPDRAKYWATFGTLTAMLMMILILP